MNPGEIFILVIAFLASVLTFFSGFGLGTILLPVFSLFFPVEIAIALTAIVHFSNNLLKLGLIFTHIQWKIILKFGIFSVAGAFAGAWLLQVLLHIPILLSYEIKGQPFDITWLKLVLGVMIILFALLDNLKLEIKSSNLNMGIGGLLSGFFGGLSGHQGALRTAFLAKLKMSKEAFIATGVAIACMVDITRLGIYSQKFDKDFITTHSMIISLAVLSAFAGSLVGKVYLKKVSIEGVKRLVTIMLILMGTLLIAGII